MIKICQTNLTSAVINNGYRSDWFDVQKGLRQGCPLSCQLFVCFIEAIAAKICQEKGIIGIQLQGKEKKLAQYADDLWIVLRHIESSYKKLFYVLDQFSVFSGLKINYDKTEVMRIGSLYKTNAKYYSELPIIGTDGPVKILGIWCLPKVKEMTQLNIQAVMSKVNDICIVWSKRSLTLIDKIQVINTLIIPLFTYRLFVINK